MQQDKPEISPIRILHFSDFHLNGEKIEDAQHVLNNMIKSLHKINTERQIDLVIFSGDMLEQGGVGYGNNLVQGFTDFQSKVINPILSTLKLPQERFIFTPGNHDVNRKSDKKSLEEYCSNHSNGTGTPVVYNSRIRLSISSCVVIPILTNPGIAGFVSKYTIPYSILSVYFKYLSSMACFLIAHSEITLLAFCSSFSIVSHSEIIFF